MNIYLQTFFCLFTVVFANAQSLTISPNSKLVMRGNISLVIRNAALINNGTLVDSAGTVQFSGNKDTMFSFLAGTKTTSVYNLTINKSGFGTALKSAVAVQNVLGVYNGILYPDSNLVLRSDKNLTARVDVIPAGADIIGKSIVERYFPKRRAWRLLTSPLKNTPGIFETWQNKGVYEQGINTFVTGPNPTGAGGNGLDASPQNNSSMKTWNTATQLYESVVNTHAPLSPANAMDADNIGYFLFVRGDRDPANFNIPNSSNTTLSSNGQLQTGTQHLTACATGGAYTLMGNPFASPINFNSVIRTNLVKRFYVWDPSLNMLGGYVMLDDLDNDGIFTKSINASTQTNHIQSSQAFLVETQANGAAGIHFPEPCKSSGNNNMLFRPVTNTFQSMRIILNLLESDGSVIVADGVLLECNNTYADSINRDDALKFANINETLSLLRHDKSLAAERRPALSATDTLFFKLLRTTQRKYQFQMEPAGINDPSLTAWLEDSYLNTSVPVDLYQTSVIKFSVDTNSASAANNRFRIVFKSPTVLPVVLLSVDAYVQNKDVVVNWSVANELNIKSYEVERSLDGVNFSGITAVSPENNTAQHQYNIYDHQPVAGYNYYRIKYMDEDGTVHYSTVVKVKMNEPATSSITVFPNPIENNTIHLQFSNCTTGKYHVRLLSETGQVIYESDIKLVSASRSLSITPPVHLPAATYLLEIMSEKNTTITKKITVN